jgi:hypothetical protein
MRRAPDARSTTHPHAVAASFGPGGGGGALAEEAGAA